MIKSLKKIMDGLSAQYADEYLSNADKDQILNHHSLKHGQFFHSQLAKVILPKPLTNEKNILLYYVTILLTRMF